MAVSQIWLGDVATTLVLHYGEWPTQFSLHCNCFKPIPSLLYIRKIVTGLLRPQPLFTPHLLVEEAVAVHVLNQQAVVVEEVAVAAHLLNQQAVVVAHCLFHFAAASVYSAWNRHLQPHLYCCKIHHLFVHILPG